MELFLFDEIYKYKFLAILTKAHLLQLQDTKAIIDLVNSSAKFDQTDDSTKTLIDKEEIGNLKHEIHNTLFKLVKKESDNFQKIDLHNKFIGLNEHLLTLLQKQEQ